MKIPLVWSHADGLDNQAVPKYLYGDPDVWKNICIRRTVGKDRQKCKETSNMDIMQDTSGPLVDKQQKRGEYVENIKFSSVFKVNFMFSTFSPL
jgi:hypothetical protein